MAKDDDEEGEERKKKQLRCRIEGGEGMEEKMNETTHADQDFIRKGSSLSLWSSSLSSFSSSPPRLVNLMDTFRALGKSLRRRMHFLSLASSLSPSPSPSPSPSSSPSGSSSLSSSSGAHIPSPFAKVQWQAAQVSECTTCILANVTCPPCVCICICMYIYRCRYRCRYSERQRCCAVPLCKVFSPTAITGH